MSKKLNKELQNRLSSFLNGKEEHLKKLLIFMNVAEFTYSQDEINEMQDLYLEHPSIREYMYVYIGEAVIKKAGGYWTINDAKRDEAYGLPIILGWRSKLNYDDTPRISPDTWLYHIENKSLRKPLGDMIYSL